MRNTLFVVLMITGMICITGVFADSATIPDLKGNWTGTSVGHTKGGGYDDLLTYIYKLSIVEQKDRAFNGTIAFVNKSDEKYLGEFGFSGVIGPDMKSLYLAEYEDGLDFGQIIDSDTIEIIYMQSGKNAAVAIETFTRDSSE